MAAMTSSGDLWFMEKANVVSAFAPEYHIGVQGTWEHDQFLGVAGVHFKKIEGNKEKDYSESNNKAGRMKEYRLQPVLSGNRFRQIR